MRRGRWLILVAIVLIAIAIGATYVQRKAALARDTPAPPPRLETGVDGRANDWVYTQSDGNSPRVTVRAKSFKQVRAPSVLELDGVELQLFHRDGSAYDLVRSAQAEFDVPGKSLYSDGEVEISMGLPVEGSKPPGRILKIRGSGVRFASDTGKATTDREAHFLFEQGGGSATGAEYDPNTRQLHLLSNVKLDWRGKTKETKPMHVEAGEAIYLEAEARVLLQPWSKLTRDTLNMEAGPATVLLQNGAVQEVITEAARGVQEDPGRRIEFAGDHLTIQFGELMLVRNIKGQQNGKLISTSKGLRTTITADLLNLDFDPEGRQSILTNAVATGKSVAAAEPIPQRGEPLADTRILRSETIRLKMRPNGQDIDSVVTDGPGTVDFLPNRPAEPKRWLKGDRIWINYGSENRIQTFRSINATTRTDRPSDKPSDKPAQPPPPPQFTSSKELVGTFDPKTSELARLEQKTDFRYEEGARRAIADRANLDQAKDVMTLDGGARVWDPTGSAAGDHIALNQKSGDYLVEGHVATTRMPDNNDKPGMLSNAEVLQARAQRMTSAENNQKIHYEGAAVAWQGANRVEADRLDIDRTRHILEAHGKVVSQFLDKDKDGGKDGSEKGRESDKGRGKDAQASPVSYQTASKSAAKLGPIFTVVRAPDLVYDEDTRVANYQGGAALTRPGLTVAGKAIRAFLRDSDSDSSLDKAFADGEVKIVHTAGPRTRTGTSEHAEYYTDEQKVLLDGGDPVLVDSLKGETRGRQLTWFANNDRLLVNGVESRPADSLLRKK
ncbi:MAG TPA: LPS export ABC transporter periplasmic protein LptC [Bryobacteraceae bacterium]|nr:LPS export ABC transporter periplasmic protein LptC [Bryobacteraceae bacterium]